MTDWWDEFTPEERKKIITTHFWTSSWPLRMIAFYPIAGALVVVVFAIAGKTTHFDVTVSVSLVANLALGGATLGYYRAWQKEKALRVEAEKKARPAPSRKKRPTARRSNRP